MRDLIISLCIPAMNRTDDLIAVMPTIIKAANASPPVEVAILGYNNSDLQLEGYVKQLQSHSVESGLLPSNRILFSEYRGGECRYFHMAHSRNLSVLASIGEYIVISSCDIRLDPDFFSSLRAEIDLHHPAWLNFRDEQGVVCVQRNEFINAGGFDERFEFYGSEDKDLFLRLVRRGNPHINIREKKFYAITTGDTKKLQNYRLKISKKEMDERGKVFYYENIRNQVQTANPEGWGLWA